MRQCEKLNSKTKKIDHISKQLSGNLDNGNMRTSAGLKSSVELKPALQATTIKPY